MYYWVISISRPHYDANSSAVILGERAKKPEQGERQTVQQEVQQMGELVGLSIGLPVQLLLQLRADSSQEMHPTRNLSN